MCRLIVGLTLALALVTPPAAARQAVALVKLPAAQQAVVAMTISTFYMSTKQAFQQWDRTRPLPRVNTFPAHTRAIGYYFEYSGGAGSASSQVYIRDHKGNIVVSNPV